MSKSPEEEARKLLYDIPGFRDDYRPSAGDVVGIANLIADNSRLKRELAEARRVVDAVNEWREREWKALSKSWAMDGYRAHSLVVLEQDMDEAKADEQGGGE